MKKYSWITVIPLAMLALITHASRPAFSISAVPDKKECDCSNLKTLQLELRNAIRLQQNYRKEIAVLRGMEQDPDADTSYPLKKFGEGEGPGTARAGLEPNPQPGPDSGGYTGRGQGFLDPTKTHSASEQCEMDMGSSNDYERVLNAAACAGIARALQAHEEFHIHACVSLGGWRAYFTRKGSAKAQEEVDAYGAEIAVLRAEIAKVLEKAEIHVILDVNTRMQMPPNPLYTAINITNNADIPMSRVSATTDLIKLEGDGQQQTNGSIEGNCRFNSGLPSSIPARATVETDGVEAKINYNLAGTAPGMTMQCTVGNKTGYGMSIPVPISSNAKYDFTVVFEDGATKEFDQASGQSAQVMARGGAKMSGKGIVRLMVCSSGK